MATTRKTIVLQKRYYLIAKIGEGGMGKVFLAKDTKLGGRAVAVKFLSQELAKDKKLFARFEQEILALSQLEHPNIVQVYDRGKSAYGPFMVMQFIRGKTLRRILEEKGKLDVEEALRITLEIAKALEFAHRHGILHRDIKPDNIMIQETGEVKVTDFGLAKFLGKSHLTQSGHYLGTPQYSSPEQCLGEEIDERSDLYSLGVVLYEMLSSDLPHKAETPLQLMRKIVDEPPRPIEQPDLPAPVLEMLNRLLAKNPKERYSSAKELIQDIEAFLFKRKAPLSPLSSSPFPSSLPLWTWPLLGGGVALLLLTILWLFSSEKDTPASSSPTSLASTATPASPATSKKHSTSATATSLSHTPKQIHVYFLGVRTYFPNQEEKWMAELYHDILLSKILEFSQNVILKSVPKEILSLWEDHTSSPSPSLLKELHKRGGHYLLMGKIQKQEENLILTAKLYSIQGKFFPVTTQATDEHLFEAAAAVAKRISLHIANQPLPVFSDEYVEKEIKSKKRKEERKGASPLRWISPKEKPRELLKRVMRASLQKIGKISPERKKRGLERRELIQNRSLSYKELAKILSLRFRLLCTIQKLLREKKGKIAKELFVKYCRKRGNLPKEELPPFLCSLAKEIEKLEKKLKTKFSQ